MARGHEGRLHVCTSVIGACFLRFLPILQHVLCGLFTREPGFYAFDKHIRLAEREWIDVVLGVEVGESVVDETMCGLVGTNGIDDVEQSCVGTEAPIVDGDGWGRQTRPL